MGLSCPPPLPVLPRPCPVGQRGAVVLLLIADSGQGPRGQGHQLDLRYLLEKKCLHCCFLSEAGHLVLIPPIMSVPLVERPRRVLVFIVGVAWPFGLSPDLASTSLSSNRFLCVYKTSANKLTFFYLSLFLLLKLIAPRFSFKADLRQQDT